jgi:CBS domain-containing protein
LGPRYCRWWAGADGALLGIVTDGDLRRSMAHLMDRTAGIIATRYPVTVTMTPDILAARAGADERTQNLGPIGGGRGCAAHQRTA